MNENASEEKNYTPIRISTLKPDMNIPFELHIFFKEQYIQYSPSGESIEKEKFRKLRRQKIAKFFILDSSETLYQEFLDDLLNETLNSEDATIEEKVEVVEGAALSATDQMLKDPGSESAYKLTTNAARSLRKLIEDNPDALKNIFGKETDEEDDPIVKHCLNVSALSLKFAKLMKCTEEEIDNVSIAGLIHDIGINELDEETKALFLKSRNDHSPQERLKFGEHCKNVAKIMSEKPYINQEILHLVENHEEDRTGSGPLKSQKPTLLVEIISLINRYDEKIITKNITPKEALDELLIDELGAYDLSMINYFKKVLKEQGIV